MTDKLPTATLRLKCYALNPPMVSHVTVLIDEVPVAIVEIKNVELVAGQLSALKPEQKKA